MILPVPTRCSVPSLMRRQTVARLMQRTSLVRLMETNGGNDAMGLSSESVGAAGCDVRAAALRPVTPGSSADITKPMGDHAPIALGASRPIGSINIEHMSHDEPNCNAMGWGEMRIVHTSQ